MRTRATAETKVTREKLLVIGMVREVLEKHYGEPPMVWEGAVKGFGRFEAIHPAHHMEEQLARLKGLGETLTMARTYMFKGGVVLSDGKRHKLEVNCEILEDPKRPRAAQASLVIAEGVYWYEFMHYKSVGVKEQPVISRFIQVDPLSPNHPNSSK